MRKLLLFLIPVLLIAAGCSPEQQYVGKWRGKIEMGQALKSFPGGGMASSYAGMMNAQLDLRPDKTFTLSFTMAPIDGTWKLENDEVILTPKTVMGMSAKDVKEQAQKEIDKAKSSTLGMPLPMPFSNGLPSEMKLAINKDQTLTLDPASGTMLAGFGKIVFTKA